MTMRRVTVCALVMAICTAALIGLAVPATAAGGDFALDFVAAGPGSYNHDTGVGGAYGDRHISKDDGVVESLEGGDFECGDRVVYFLKIEVSEWATSAQDIELDFSFLAEPTGQPGAGITDLVSASGSSGDSGNEGNTEDTTVSIEEETLDKTPPPPTDTLFATVRVSNLDPDETFILRLVTKLTCVPGSEPTGNLQADLVSAEEASSGEAIPSGAQTIPFKQVGDIPIPSGVTVDLGDCVSGVGESHTPVTVTISPSGSATVEIEGPDGFEHTFTGSGGTIDLEPGDYTWSAEATDGHVLVGDDSGSLDVSDCKRIPTTVSVKLGTCVPAVGESHTPLTVEIDPKGGAKVFLEGPDGLTHTFEGSGGTIDLAPGEYSWDADKTHGHVIVSKKMGEFEVEDCALALAKATVTLGACVFTGGVSTTPVSVGIDPEGGATVEIRNAAGAVIQPGSAPAPVAEPPDEGGGDEGGDEGGLDPDEIGVAGAIESVFAGLAPGTYTWTATAAEGFVIDGASSGTLIVAGCAVLAAKLPRTGASVPFAGAMGLAFLATGFVLVALPGRAPRAALAGWGSLRSKLNGRSMAGMYLPGYGVLVPNGFGWVFESRPVWQRRTGYRSDRSGRNSD